MHINYAFGIFTSLLLSLVTVMYDMYVKFKFDRMEFKWVVYRKCYSYAISQYIFYLRQF